MRAWRCSVCGYIHYGDTPPDSCPQCGAPKEAFVLQEGNAAEEGVTRAGAARPESGESSTKQFPRKRPPDAEAAADVIVAGSGAAAFAAAVTARNEGCSVIILEKAASIGGTTIMSGGGFWTPNNRFQRARGIKDDREQALKYMARYSFPHLYRPEGERYGVPENEFQLLEAVVDHAAEMPEYLENIGAFKVTEEINWTGQLQVDYQSHLPENGLIRGRVLYTQDDSGKPGFGFVLVTCLRAWADSHDIRILLDHEVARIPER